MKTKIVVQTLVLWVSAIGLPLAGQSVYTPGGTVGTSSNGNTGIGTSTPTETLHVNGSIRAAGRSRVKISRSVSGSTGDTVAVGSFSSDGVGKSIRINLKAHNGSVIDVHSYEINEVAYIGSLTQWLELPLGGNSVSYSGSAGYAVDVYRPNIGSHTDALYLRVRVKRPLGAGTVYMVIEYDEDVIFSPLTSSSSTATSFNSTTAPAGGGVDGYYGALEWAFPVSNGQGWSTATNAGLFVKNSGNVGIGTTSPTSRFTVEGGFTEIRSGNDLMLRPTANDWDYRLRATGYRFDIISGGDLSNPRLTVAQSGNVGIGTTNPQRKLHINNGGVQVEGNTSSLWYDASIYSVDSAPGGRSYAFGSRGGAFSISDETAAAFRLYINPAGNVGIGTTNPSHKLAVNGTIRAKEVIVDTGWADYVFDEDYQLAPLSEVEAHIKEKKHLPGIPSTAEIEAGGVSLGDMQARMMAKIEELTLHLIEIKKENTAQSAQLVNLAQENRELRRQLSSVTLNP